MNHAFRAAFWAMFLSVGVTLLMLIPDPHVSRKALLARDVEEAADSRMARATDKSSQQDRQKSGGRSQRTETFEKSSPAEIDRSEMAQNRNEAQSSRRPSETAVGSSTNLRSPADLQPASFPKRHLVRSERTDRGNVSSRATAQPDDQRRQTRGAEQPTGHANETVGRLPVLFIEAVPEEPVPLPNREPGASASTESQSTASRDVTPVLDGKIASSDSIPSVPRVELGPIVAVDRTNDDAEHNPRRNGRSPLPEFPHGDAKRDEQDDRNALLEVRLASLQRDVQRLAQSQEDRKNADLERMTQLLQQIQQTQQLQSLEQQVKQLQQIQQQIQQAPAGGSSEGSSASSPATESSSGSPSDVPQPEQKEQGTSGSPAVEFPSVGSSANPFPLPEPEKKPVFKAQPIDEDGERFSLQIQDAELSHVLEMLGQLAGLNILMGRDVQGKVSVNLQHVTVDQALEGILRSLGYVHQREGEFIFVMSTAEAESRRKLNRKLITKVYRPHYISVRELQSLVTPLVTPEVGKIALTTPSEIGLEVDPEKAGGDQLSQRDALLIQDYPEVIEAVDGVLDEMDVPPAQVVIEAMILSVRLNDSMEFGVNFALLGKGNKDLVLSGNGAVLGSSSGFPGTQPSILPAAGEFLANAAGLKYGMIHGDISLFIDALEEITDTNLIASPQLRVLNKQRAQLIIGKRLGYSTRTFNNTQTIENVNFIDAGTKLIIRPFIGPDGYVRMEVHPEQSSAVINEQTQLPDVTTTEVTTNVMVRDGSTVVIGGLIEESTVQSIQRVPFLGAIPVVGNAFRNKTDRTERHELIVLITPRIVRDVESEQEGDAILFESERRADHFKANLNHIGRYNLARLHYESALSYYEEGEFDRAHRHIEKALRQDKNNLEALRLRDLIEAEIEGRNRRWFQSPFGKRGEIKGRSVQKATDKPVPPPKFGPPLPQQAP